jgi:hypothetical protein
MPKTYHEKLKEMKFKQQALMNLLNSALILNKYFQDEKEVSELIMPVLSWFEKKGLITIDEVPDDDNLLDFSTYLERKKLFTREEGE